MNNASVCTRSDDGRVRTDFLLRNIYSYLVRDRYRFESVPPPANAKEEKVLDHFQKLCTEHDREQSSSFASLDLEKMESSQEATEKAIFQVADELFNNGIKWKLIISFLVYVKHLTFFCLSRNYPIHPIFENLSIFTKERLERWIMDHGGWEGCVTALSIKKNRSNVLGRPMEETRSNGRTSFWIDLMFSLLEIIF